MDTILPKPRPDLSQMKFSEGIPLTFWGGLIVPKLIPLGRQDTYVGSPLDTVLPFPQRIYSEKGEPASEMFNYVLQSDMLYYLDWNLWSESAQSHIDALKNRLKNGGNNWPSSEGSREDKERLLKTWEFVRDNLDRPEFEWLKKMDNARIENENQKQVLPPDVSHIIVEGDAKSVIPAQMDLTHDAKAVANSETEEQSFIRRIIESNAKNKWIERSIRTGLSKSITDLEVMLKIPAFKDDVDIMLSLTQLEYIKDHIEDERFHDFKVLIEETEAKKNG